MHQAIAAGNHLAVLSRQLTPCKRKQAAVKRFFSSPTRQKKDKGDIYVVPHGTRKCLYLLTTVPVGFERTVLIDNGEIEVVVIFSRIFFPVFRIIFIVDIGKFCTHTVDDILSSVDKVFDGRGHECDSVTYRGRYLNVKTLKRVDDIVQLTFEFVQRSVAQSAYPVLVDEFVVQTNDGIKSHAGTECYIVFSKVV